MIAPMWQVPSVHPVLSAGEVHVWRIFLDVRGWREELGGGGLSEEERRRASRFRFAADQRRFVVRHAALRAILGAYLGASSAELVFCAGVHGKPFLDPGRHGKVIRFNMSHSHDLALVGVSRDREIGVDIELCRPLRGMAEIAARCFSPREQLAFSKVLERNRLEAFFGAWTLKEAYVKACGDGMNSNLDRVEVTIGVDEPVRLLAALDRPGDEARWTLRRLDPGGGYLAALAAEGRDHRLGTWDWPLRGERG
jgi:4'-phosphopantetheinyl transferase